MSLFPDQPLAEGVPKAVTPLEYVKVSSACGMRVSRVCLGSMTFGDKSMKEWVLTEADAKPIIARALELGINFFDTSDHYSLGASERVLGNVLRELKVNREKVVVSTKVFVDLGGVNMGGLSRKHILHACDNSLKRLQMDYIDIYQIARFDPNTPVEETMSALHSLVVSGKVRYIGASSMSAWQFAKLQHCAERHGWTQFVTMQNHYNAVYREEEREMLPYCIDTGVGCLPWSPLARGFLCGTRSPSDKLYAAAKATAKAAAAAPGTWAAAPDSKDSKDSKAAAVVGAAPAAAPGAAPATTAPAPAGSGPAPATVRAADDPQALMMYYGDADFQVLERVTAIAKARGKPPAQIALAWLLAKPGVTAPVIGATKVSHVNDAVAALSVKLTADELRAIEQPYKPRAIAGH